MSDTQSPTLFDQRHSPNAILLPFGDQAGDESKKSRATWITLRWRPFGTHDHEPVHTFVTRVDIDQALATRRPVPTFVATAVVAATQNAKITRGLVRRRQDAGPHTLGRIETPREHKPAVLSRERRLSTVGRGCSPARARVHVCGV
jgi:hypothetical protein